MSPLVVDIWIDLLSPECYLGLHAYRKALSEFSNEEQVETILHPFFSTAESPYADSLYEPKELSQERESFLSRFTQSTLDKNKISLEQRVEEIQSEGRKRGISLDLATLKTFNTFPAQQLIAFAHQLQVGSVESMGVNSLQLRMAEALFRSFFELGLDLGSPEVLIAIAQDLAIEGELAKEALDDPISQDLVEEGYSLALHLGVERVPLFLLNEEFVVSGSHDVESFINILDTAWDRHCMLENLSIETEEEK